MFEQCLTQVCEENFKDKIEVITYLANLAGESKKISNVEDYIKAVLLREEIVSTAIGYGVAIPHGESDTVNETFVGCLKLTKPILWDGVETSLIFMIGVSTENREKEHLKILAMLSRSLMREEFRTRLNNAKTSEDYFGIIKELEN